MPRSLVHGDVPRELIGFGDRLREARRDVHCTQVELSDLAGVSQGHISNIERGERSPEALSIGAIVRLSRVLGVRLLWLIAGQKPKRDASKVFPYVIVEQGTPAPTEPHKLAAPKSKRAKRKRKRAGRDRN